MKRVTSKVYNTSASISRAVVIHVSVQCICCSGEPVWIWIPRFCNATSILFNVDTPPTVPFLGCECPWIWKVSRNRKTAKSFVCDAKQCLTLGTDRPFRCLDICIKNCTNTRIFNQFSHSYTLPNECSNILEMLTHLKIKISRYHNKFLNVYSLFYAQKRVPGKMGSCLCSWTLGGA